jgi:hypothetical protein
MQRGKVNAVAAQAPRQRRHPREPRATERVEVHREALLSVGTSAAREVEVFARGIGGGNLRVPERAFVTLGKHFARRHGAEVRELALQLGAPVDELVGDVQLG